MLFAPEERNPFLWWQVQYDKMTPEEKEQSEIYWQARFDEHVQKLRDNPQILKAYERYKSLVSNL